MSREMPKTFISRMQSEIEQLRERVEDLETRYTQANAELEVYAKFAEKFGDLSCCYDADDVTAVIQRAFDSLKESPDTTICPNCGLTFSEARTKAILGIHAEGDSAK